MRIGRVYALLSIACLILLATAGVAWAHVVVSPKEVPADSYQKLVTSVPTEKDIPTTKVRVEVPEGFTVTSVEPVPGWKSDFEKESGVITAITWSGGEIAPEEFQEFPFQAKTPKDTGEYAWKAYQTYQDGSVVEWTGPPEDPNMPGTDMDTEEEGPGPASVVEVVQSGAQPKGIAQPSEPGAAAAGAGGVFIPIAAYGGLVLGALALVVALVALLRGRKTS
jgi:uncharacterized protein YcnI